jgi:coenzyme F420-0:L-glutamate ligase/coenzyme F420-1:gamma-L-glutamate ligase
MSPSAPLHVLPVHGLPSIGAGDDLAAMILERCAAAGERLEDGDVVVVASKVVAKAEGRVVSLDDVVPSARASELASRTGKDDRLVELVLRESTQVVRAQHGVLLVRHRLGFVSANAAIDASNVGTDRNEVLLLPADPDESARSLASSLRSSGAQVGVVISDTHGRAFRRGNVGVAIGVGGVTAMATRNGEPDLYGRTLEATFVPVADLAASAAGIVTGEGAEGVPVVIVRGLPSAVTDALDRTSSADLVRTAEEDLFAGGGDLESS